MRAHRERAEDGAVAILAAVLAVALLVTGALVVELGLARDTKRQAQVAADASALAGANALYPDGSCEPPTGGTPPCLDDAVAAVRAYAAQNYGVTAAEWTSCVDETRPTSYVTRGSACISFDQTTKPSRIRVKVPARTRTAGIGALAGVDEISVSSRAEAEVTEGQQQSCSLCFLGPADAINADFTVTGGSIRVNGDITAGPNSNWTASGGIGVAGTWSAGANYSPTPTVTAPFTDPLATMAMPSTTGLTAKSNPCSTGSSGGPGIYGSFSLPNSTCTLRSGLYVVTGTWDMKNNTRLLGTGVTLYVRYPSGQLDFKNGNVLLTAPLTGPQANMAIVYDRTNTKPLTLQGNGLTSITGLVYAAGAKLEFNGNSCFGFTGGPVVVNGLIQANGNKSCATVLDALGATLPPLPGDVALSQ